MANDWTEQSHAPVSRPAASWREMLVSVLNGYAIVLFAQRPVLGGVLLALTFLEPRAGLFGLAGVCIAYAAAQFLDLERARLRSGELLYNSLLSSLGLAYLVRLHPVDWPLLTALLPVVAVAALALTVAIGHATRQLFGLPSLSLPFVVTTFLLFCVFQALSAVPVATLPVYLIAEPDGWPAWALNFCRALGTAFFLPHAVAGLVIALCLIVHSRLSLLLGVVGYVMGMTMMRATGLSGESFGDGWLGTNFIYCGIALGGVFFIAAPATLPLIAVGVTISALVAISLGQALGSLGIPPLSLPFVVCTLVMVYALRRRESYSAIFENPYWDAAPEACHRRFQLARLRFPASYLPALRVPFHGQRVVTQGMGGALTHQGSSGNALDFEALDAQGHAWPPGRENLEDSYTFGTYVLAPCDGVVARIVQHVPDNLPGVQNLRENWGNLVTIHADAGGYVTLSHFQQGGIDVSPGERVAAGQRIGRCGNSGRSPLPHLHLQMQTGPAMTSPTTPFRLRHYVSLHADGTRRYWLGGIPPQGTRLEPASFDPRVATCFNLGDKRRQRFCIVRGGRMIGVETIEINATPWGEIELRSPQRNAAFYLALDADAAVAHSFSGPADCLLAALSLGLSLTPFTADRRLSWQDFADARPLSAFWRGWLADLIGPYFGMPRIEMSHRFDVQGSAGMVGVTTEIRGGRQGNADSIQRVDVRLLAGLEIAEVVIECNERVTRYVREEAALRDKMESIAAAETAAPSDKNLLAATRND